MLAVIMVSAMIATSVTDVHAAAPVRKRKTQRSAESVKKEQTNTQRKISETSTRLNTTGQELKRQLNSLNSLNADIRQQDATVKQLRSRIDSIGAEINSTADSISTLESELEEMRSAYAKAVKSMQPAAGDMNTLSFIFSSRSFSEAYSRMRYLNRFTAWR